MLAYDSAEVEDTCNNEFSEQQIVWLLWLYIWVIIIIIIIIIIMLLFSSKQ